MTEYIITAAELSVLILCVGFFTCINIYSKNRVRSNKNIKILIILFKSYLKLLSNLIAGLKSIVCTHSL